MRRATARVVLAATLAVATAGCGGSKPPPERPPSWEIDLTGQSSAASAPGAVLAPEDQHAPSAAADVAIRKLAPGSVPKLRPNQPSRGPQQARVVIQVWSDFECPFCARALPLLSSLEQEFGADVRVTWRALPLPSHVLARESATAALEAHAQRGAATFWRVHDRLFAEARDGLDEREIERVLRDANVDVARYTQALEAGAHDADIAVDVAAADAIAVEGTPAFLVNDYYVFGIQPLEVMRAVVERARSEAR